jgi:hypothetical protein
VHSGADSRTESEPDAAIDNLRRMRLRHTPRGGPKLRHLKFDEPNDSSHPEREPARPLEQYPLLASQLNPRLRALPADEPLSPRQFALSESHDIKGLGFNGHSRPAATTGTSKPNVLCVTDGMGPCIAVALGAEKLDADGTARLPGAKARVLHVHPTLPSDELVQTLRARVGKYQAAGLTVKAALHGGWHFNEQTAATIRSTLTDLGVAIEFDESGDKRNGNTPLGAVVQDDHSVRFVTELGYRT